MTRRIDMHGMRFGKLLVVSAAASANTHARWNCRCDCGNETIADASHLRQGNIRSCGCLNYKPKGHGGASGGRKRWAPEYGVWLGIRKRCFCKTAIEWKNYGGRGITICERWVNDYQAFFSDMGPRPTPNHSIDRIDNDGPYSPENCRWATAVVQARNTRRCARIEHDGVTMSVPEWCERLGLKYSTVRSRIHRGMPPLAALGLLGG